MAKNIPTTVSDNSAPKTKRNGKKFKSNFVKITAEEIEAGRPSVYKYLLP